MVESCRVKFSDASNMRFAVMNGEKIDVTPYSFDRIASSMTIQWFENPSKTLEDLLLCLKPDGIMHYATTGCDNFMEWREHLAQRGLDCAQRQMPKKLPGMYREELIIRDYKSGRGFIDMLRKTGADAPKPDYVRPAPRAFLEAVDSFDGKVTWHIISGQMQLKI
jgi:malonyl-CoA O-methyltransferase